MKKRLRKVNWKKLKDQSKRVVLENQDKKRETGKIKYLSLFIFVLCIVSILGFGGIVVKYVTYVIYAFVLSFIGTYILVVKIYFDGEQEKFMYERNQMIRIFMIIQIPIFLLYLKAILNQN